MILNGVMAVTLRYFTVFGKHALQKTICGGIYAKVLYFLVRVQCRRKESSRSQSHLLVRFLLVNVDGIDGLLVSFYRLQSPLFHPLPPFQVIVYPVLF